MILRFGSWFEDRTGIPEAIRGFFEEQIPASSGWAQVFGSVVLFLLLVQVFTGVLLAINFAPTPGEAYDSLKYIVSALTGGRMVRGLHHWGASMMIVVLGLHLIQVFVYGAYRKPREATWIVGVMLLLIILGFGLTGYLLPWDNRAYWGTVVTTQMAGEAPLLGQHLQRLLGVEPGSESRVGAVTYARFYTLHTVILPMLACILVAFHLYLVRRHGITPVPTESKPPVRFFPGQAFKDTCAIFVAFVVLFAAAAAATVPLEQVADPTDTTYIPRPDWYFLFLFQTLKLFRGAFEQIGSILLPTLAVLLLFAVPFLDRGRLRVFRRRSVAIGTVLGCAACWTALTTAAVLTMPPSVGLQTSAPPWARLSPPALAGFGDFRQAGCPSCHNLLEGQPRPGPNLAELDTSARRMDSSAHLTRVSRLDDAQRERIAAFLRSFTPEDAETFLNAPPAAIEGAQLLVANACMNCHSVKGEGGAIGPPFDGVSVRRSRNWIAQHLRDPQSQTPGSIMPSFSLSTHDRDLLIAYLCSLPGR